MDFFEPLPKFRQHSVPAEVTSVSFQNEIKVRRVDGRPLSPGKWFLGRTISSLFSPMTSSGPELPRLSVPKTLKDAENRLIPRRMMLLGQILGVFFSGKMVPDPLGGVFFCFEMTSSASWGTLSPDFLLFEH
jgi:hypothetical protein